MADYRDYAAEERRASQNRETVLAIQQRGWCKGCGSKIHRDGAQIHVSHCSSNAE